MKIVLTIANRDCLAITDFITEVVMRIFSILIMCGLLSACAIDSVQRQPEVQVEAVTHKIALQLDQKGLSQSDQAALSEFIYQRGDSSALRIKIATYNNKGVRAIPALTALLKQAGVYPSQVTSEAGETSTVADVALFVESYRSLVPNCVAGKQKHSVLNEFKSSSNFGCANASALAQMVATPRDLAVGRTLDATEGRKAVSRVDTYYQPTTSNSEQADKNNSSSISSSLGGL
ncbi:MAG: pilus assembly protein CpaD [Moritella dasanensis]|jgi:pilus assembly protein CpaD